MVALRPRGGWSRRRLLSAAGLGMMGGALAPFLPRSIAEAATQPKRLILVTNGQGTDMTRWRPTGSETDFTLSYALAPLEAYRDRMLVLDGIDNEAAIRGPGTGHFGQGTMWTGVVVPPGTVRPEEMLGWPTAPSIDAIIAQRIGEQTKFPAYYWGVWPIATDGDNQGPNGICHYRGSEDPINPQLNPATAFDTLFEGVMGTDPAVAARIRAERRSVIDLVGGELERVRTEMPAVDRDRFDAHLDSLRELEKRISQVSAVCEVPTRPDDFTQDQVRNYDLVHVFTRLQFELMRHALLCDLTRVACFDWPHSEGYGNYMPEEGYRAFGSIHTVAHTMSYDTPELMPTDEERAIAREDMANLQQWRSAMLATELLDKLPADVLDNTLLVWASEMSEGGTHSNRNVPIVMIQGQGFGAFTAGRYLRWGSYDPITNYSEYTGGQPMNKLLVSICHAMGLDDVDVVGDATISTGPLEELA
ncbi:MAG: DUF1552 domain-containing protein [Nannocystaceae bacterium]|nr:DUF1552 domain-containing protein [Nannocystaceae bacterium]